MFLQKSYDKIRYLYNQNRELAQGVLGSLGVKVLSVAVSFLTTPVYMRYFSEQAILGVWFTLVSLFNMFLSFDLGIGNGLRNRLTESLTQNDQKKTREYISSAYIAITAFIFVLAFIVVVLVQFAPLNDWLHISAGVISARILKNGITICAMGLCVQCVLRIITSIYFALQKAAIPSLLTLLTNFLLLLTAWLAPQHNTAGQKFLILSLAHAVATNLPLLLATVLVFRHRLSRVRPSFRSFDFATAKDLLRLGLTFFLLQAAGLLLTGCNETLITVCIDPKWTVHYQVYYKIFSLPSTLFFMVLTPFWSAITKALAEHRYQWLKKAHQFVCWFAILGAVGALLLIPFIPFIARVWLKDQAAQVEILWQYSLWFAIWCGTNMWMHGNCTFANGLEWMRVQKRLVFPAGFASVFCIAAAARITQSWLVAIQVNIIVQLIIGTVQMAAIRTGLQKLPKEENR